MGAEQKKFIAMRPVSSSSSVWLMAAFVCYLCSSESFLSFFSPFQFIVQSGSYKILFGKTLIEEMLLCCLVRYSKFFIDEPDEVNDASGLMEKLDFTGNKTKKKHIFKFDFIGLPGKKLEGKKKRESCLVLDEKLFSGVLWSVSNGWRARKVCTKRIKR